MAAYIRSLQIVLKRSWTETLRTAQRAHLTPDGWAGITSSFVGAMRAPPVLLDAIAGPLRRVLLDVLLPLLLQPRFCCALLRTREPAEVWNAAVRQLAHTRMAPDGQYRQSRERSVKAEPPARELLTLLVSMHLLSQF